MSRPSEVPEWDNRSAGRLRSYLEPTKRELISQLEFDAPPDATREELLRDPSDTIVRRQLLKEGWEMCVKRLLELAKDPGQGGGEHNGEFSGQQN